MSSQYIYLKIKIEIDEYIYFYWNRDEQLLINIICLDCLIDLILPSLMKEGGWNPNKLECDVKLAIFSFTKLYILNTIKP